MQTISQDSTTGLILAGGQGSRIGGKDKGLIRVAGQLLIASVKERFSPQVDSLVISCNRNLDQYAAFASQLVGDDLPDYQGPLAGIQACSGLLETPLLAVVPCDAPDLPRDLVSRLRMGLKPETDAAYAHDGSRPQYLFAIVRQRALPKVHGYLEKGERSMRGWYSQLNTVEVDFSDQPDAFTNINNQ